MHRQCRLLRIACRIMRYPREIWTFSGRLLDEYASRLKKPKVSYRHFFARMHGLSLAHLSCVRAFRTGHCELRVWVLLEAELLGDDGKVRACKAQHQRRSLSFVDDAWVYLHRFKYRFGVRIQHELERFEIPGQASRRNIASCGKENFPWFSMAVRTGRGVLRD